MKHDKNKLIAIIQEICAIIYYQQALKKQDEWLNARIKDGLWNLELCEDEEYENGFVMEGEE
tara:strand:- start:50 stop:235 length:186 start_codon:yes stop_codon:yes gene_type:complete